jgi:hypothetical protein
MLKKHVLAIGVDPTLVDFGAFPRLAPEGMRSYIDAHIERLREENFEVTSCLVDFGETAEAVAMEALQSARFECVVIEAGVRLPPERLLMFERIINLTHRLAPNASICFNSSPADITKAVERWIAP